MRECGQNNTWELIAGMNNGEAEKLRNGTCYCPALASPRSSSNWTYLQPETGESWVRVGLGWLICSSIKMFGMVKVGVLPCHGGIAGWVWFGEKVQVVRDKRHKGEDDRMGLWFRGWAFALHEWDPSSIPGLLKIDGRIVNLLGRQKWGVRWGDFGSSQFSASWSCHFSICKMEIQSRDTLWFEERINSLRIKPFRGLNPKRYPGQIGMAPAFANHMTRVKMKYH